MKKLNKLLFLSSAGLLALSVASCSKKENRNLEIPMGNLDTSAIIAKNDDYQLKNDLFYTRLRYKGYNTVLNEIKKSLFNEEYTFVKSQINLSDSTVTDYEQELFDSFANEVFGASTATAIKKLDDDEKETSIQKIIDTYSNKGITLKKSDCLSYSFVGEKVKFNSIPEDIINDKLISIAQNKATKDALDKIVDSEKILDDDEKEVANSNYISEKNYSSKYDSTYKTYGTYRAIIIQFNNLNEARNVITAVENQMGRSLTDSNSDEFALEFYVNLYNTYYNYRTQINPNSPFENNNEDSKTIFVVNEEKNELSEMSSSISNLVTTTLDEDNTYIKQPFNQDSKYVMIYRGHTEFDLNKEYDIKPYNEQIEWNDLKGHETAFKEVKADLRDDLIDAKISSYSSTVLTDRINDAEIEIYDPYFEYQFKNTYDDYELINSSKFDKNLIFKLTYNNKTTLYSVDSFYQAQSKASILEIVVEFFKLEYVYEFKDVLMDADDISDIEEELDKAIKAFKNNENSAYPSSVGLNTYLIGTYGYTTKEDVLKYNKLASSSLLNAYLSQNVFDEWALNDENHGIDTSKLNILQNILDAGNENYSNLFSINIDHILIFIDDDGDGSPDDPKDFLKNFDDTKKEDFNKALLELANAIYAEATCEELTKSNSILDILKYIVGAYNRNDSLFSSKDENGNPTKTWADYKKYNFLLTAESLSSSGDTTQSNVSNYVEEFGAYVKDLYKKAVENDLKIEDKKSTFYFVESLDKSPSKLEDLCATEFGYHMIVVNSYTKPSTTKSTESSDTYGYYKDIEILINEKDKDTTDDNIYVVVENTYNNEEKKATMNQLFVYYVQKQKSITSSLDSSLREVLSSMFDDAITRYTSTSFQSYLLFNDLKITSSNEVLVNQLNNYKDYLKRTSQEYKADDDFEAWYGSDINWSRPYSK